MLSTKKMGKKEKFNILDIKIEIKGLKLLGEEKQLVPLTDMDIRDFKDLMGKTNLRDRERRIFNDAAEKIASVFSIYDDVLNEYLSKGEFNRRQLKKLIGKKYWEKIVEAYRTQHGVDLDKLDELDRRKILSTRREHMNYAENAILCLLDVDDFSNNTNYNDGIRIASLAKFDDRYFERPEVKQLLERDQRLFTEVLEYYPTAHEIAELNHKYTYVSHFISLFDYYRALPKIADAELYLQGLMQGDEQPPLPSITDSPFEGSPLGLEHLPMSGSPLRQGLYPAAQLEFMTPLSAGKSRQSMGSNRLQHSSGQRRSDYTGTPLNGNNDSFLSSQYSMLGPEEESAFEEQQARRNARAWVLPNIVSPNRVTDQKKLSQLQQYFIDFLLSYDHRNNEYVDNGYLNMFILDACLLDEDIDEDSFEENVHKNSAFDFLTQNRELLLKMLNLLPDAKVAHDVESSFLSKVILAIESVDKASFAKQWQSDYKNTFKEEVINPEKLEGLAIQLLAHELKNNEAVYSRFFMALSRLEVNISEENRRKWINLLITLALNKPEYASRLLDRRYSFRWFSNQAKAYLEIGDIKKILLGSLTGKEDNRRYVDDQMSLVFSRRFFWLLSPDAMKFSGEDLIDLLNGGQSDSLSRAVSSDSRYLKKILHALNDKAQKGDSESVLKILTHLHSYHLSVFNGLNGEYKEFKEQFKETIVFDFPETGELTGYKPRAMTAKKPRRETPSAKAPLALGPEEFNGQVSSLIKGGTPIASLPLNGLPEDLDDGASDDGLSNEVHSSDEAEDDHLERVLVIEAHQSLLRGDIPSAPSYLGGISGGINVIQTGTSLIDQSSPVLGRDDDNLDGRRGAQGVLSTVPTQLASKLQLPGPRLAFLDQIIARPKRSDDDNSDKRRDLQGVLPTVTTQLGSKAQLPRPPLSLLEQIRASTQHSTRTVTLGVLEPSGRESETVQGRSSFFNKQNPDMIEMRNILDNFFADNKITLKTGDWLNTEQSKEFITALQMKTIRTSAFKYIKDELLIPDDNNWDDVNPKLVITDKLSEDLVTRLAKMDRFKNWRQTDLHERLGKIRDAVNGSPQ